MQQCQRYKREGPTTPHTHTHSHSLSRLRDTPPNWQKKVKECKTEANKDKTNLDIKANKQQIEVGVG